MTAGEIVYSIVRNLSSKILDPPTLEVLEMGFSFIPESVRSLYEIYECMAANARVCRLRAYFHNNDRGREDLMHGCWKIPTWNAPTSKSAVLEKYLTTQDILILGEMEGKDEQLEGYNIPSPDMRIIKRLMADTSILIKKADKGAVVVVMDRVSYVQEMMSSRHLGDPSSYKKLAYSRDQALNALNRKVKAFIPYVVRAGGLPEFMSKTLLVRDAKLGVIYGQPKIHKGEDGLSHVGYPMRCICASTAHPCEGLSLFVDKTLKPLMTKDALEDMVVDTTEFLSDSRACGQALVALVSLLHLALSHWM